MNGTAGTRENEDRTITLLLVKGRLMPKIRVVYIYDVEALYHVRILVYIHVFFQEMVSHDHGATSLRKYSLRQTVSVFCFFRAVSYSLRSLRAAASHNLFRHLRAG